MMMFVASISIIVAAVLGSVAGFIVGVRFMKRVAKGIDHAMQDAAIATPLAAGWAYEQVDKRIRSGATLEQIKAFLAAEGDRIAGGLNSPDVGKQIWEGGADPQHDDERCTCPRDDDGSPLTPGLLEWNLEGREPSDCPVHGDSREVESS